MQKLAIRTDSWHYRYFMFLRSVWGCDGAPQMRSLCPYFQSILWLSVITIALSPFMILGWVMLKFERILYKSLVNLGFHGVVDWLDDTFLGRAFHGAQEEVQEAPAPVTLITLFSSIIVFGLALGALGVLLYGAVLGLLNIGQAPGLFMEVLYAIWDGINRVGWAVFNMFGLVGYAMSYIAYAFTWLFTNKPLWAAIGYWTAVVLVVGWGCTMLGLLVYGLSLTRPGKYICGIVMMKLNGYGEAREKAKARREEAKLKAEIEQDKMDLAPAEPPAPGRLERFCSWVKRLFGEDIQVGKRVGTALTGLGVVWEFIKAVKRRACPIIDFVQPEPEKQEPIK
jgi:hypothetical protein